MAKEKVIFIPLTFEIIKETEKAYFIQTKFGNCSNVEKFTWIPKSVCETTEYVATYNALNEPETYGKRIIKVAAWWARKNRIY